MSVINHTRCHCNQLISQVGNVIGVYFAWWKYGDRISRRFYVTSAGAGRRNIEELRTSMSELQLPKEHDFKYK